MKITSRLYSDVVLERPCTVLDVTGDLDVVTDFCSCRLSGDSGEVDEDGPSAA